MKDSAWVEGFPLDLEGMRTKRPLYKLMRRAAYRSELLAGHTVYVWPGYVFDKASVPALALLLTGRDNPLRDGAALLHDFAYAWGWLPLDLSVLQPTKAVPERTFPTRGKLRVIPVSRKTADRLFYEALQRAGEGQLRALILYLGVRVGGWLPWGRYRKQEAHDEN